METVKKCIVCGTEFTAKREDAKYCSGSCKVKAHKERSNKPQEHKEVEYVSTAQHQVTKNNINLIFDNIERLETEVSSLSKTVQMANVGQLFSGGKSKANKSTEIQLSTLEDSIGRLREAYYDDFAILEKKISELEEAINSKSETVTE